MHIIVGNKLYRKFKQLIKYIFRFSIKKDVLKVISDKNSDLICKVYVINLDRQIDRLERFKKEVKRQKLDNKLTLKDFYERISAVDGKKFNLDKAKDIVNKKYPLTAQYYVDPDPRLLDIIKKKNINIELFPEEIAVAISHISIWKKIVENKTPYTLILEDDIFFEREFSKKLNTLWEELPIKREDGYRFDIIYLSYQEVIHGSLNTPYSKHLNKLHRGYWWLSGYVLSYPAAKFLLSKLPIIGPIDLWLNNYFEDLDVYATKKPIISQRKDLNSDNRYSILPVLSQIGIQSDKTHLILEKIKGNYPVFCIGFNQNESEHLETILSMLSYRCCNDKVGNLSKVIQINIEKNIPLLFDAYINVNSIDSKVIQLNNLYPNSVFLFNIEYDVPLIITSSRYLLLDISKEYAWKNICNFLNCKVPNSIFPSNRKKQEINFINTNPSPKREEITKNIKLLKHDVHPWVIPFERLSEYGISRNEHLPLWLKTTRNKMIDNFEVFNTLQWSAMDNTFPTNLTMFQKENIEIKEKGCILRIKKQKCKAKDYTSASFVSKNNFIYGRFEVSMKVSKADGIISAFFLHRNDPWQEIDIEILGNDTSKLLTNVYFNPGDESTKLNYGNSGTPILIDLDFDASEDFHSYAIEWEPNEIRWFVDSELIHKRVIWDPTPIPNQPMKVYSSIWSSESDSLAGILSENNLPQFNQISNITIEEWVSK